MRLRCTLIATHLSTSLLTFLMNSDRPLACRACCSWPLRSRAAIWGGESASDMPGSDREMDSKTIDGWGRPAMWTYLVSAAVRHALRACLDRRSQQPPTIAQLLCATASAPL